MGRLAPVALFVLACAGGGLEEVDRTEFGFGSYVRVRALAPTRARAESALGAAFHELHRLDTLWSAFLPGSDVERLNGRGSVVVHPETRELIVEALGYAELTDGALDITIRPLTELWGFVGGEYRLPDSGAVRQSAGLVDWHRVRVRGDSILLGEATRLELGAVAVGAAVDCAVETLASRGAAQGLVDAGGDIRVFGDRRWRIGLQSPRGAGILRVLELRDAAVSTSGDYQKCFEVGGRRYHHILDPVTGYPAEGCASVTVTAPTALAADALSTALFVLGPDRGRALIARVGGAGAVFVVDAGGSLVELEGGSLP